MYCCFQDHINVRKKSNVTYKYMVAPRYNNEIGVLIRNLLAAHDVHNR